MSSSRSNNFNNNQNQKRYIPKATTQSTQIGQPQKLTTTLRGEEETQKSYKGKFVNYLPQDEAVATGFGVENGGLDPIESQRVVDLVNKELSILLKLNPRDFWKQVAGDTSLHAFLNSYLQFRKRWYDFPHHGSSKTVAGVIVGDLELSRQILLVVYRISSSRDPGAHANDSLSAKEHGALLQETKLLDLPQLLDICAIYGHMNGELTRLLVTNVMKAQPTLHDNLLAVVSQFLSIFYTMEQRCNSSLEALLSSQGNQNGGNHGLHVDFLEVVDFINDAIASLDALVNAYKPAAVYFSCSVPVSYSNGELLGTLAKICDTFLPCLQRGLAHIFTAGIVEVHKSYGDEIPDISTSFKILSIRIINFGWKLLDFCYLGSEAFEEGNLLHFTFSKMFPANVEDPAIRGDILVQTFRELNEENSQRSKEKDTSGTFLRSLETNYKILSRLDEVRGKGWIIMDDEQFHYLSMLMLPQKRVDKNINLSSSLMNKVKMDESAVITESKISQIKDIFPDYHKDFLAACLEVYDQNPEEVIQRILEGTLHEDLKSISVASKEIPHNKFGAALSRTDKGKGALVEASPFPVTLVSTMADLKLESSSTSSPSLVGRFTRKNKIDFHDEKTLNLRDDRESAKTAILASQLEYEDEYDDSFDDLGVTVRDSGFEETESLGNSGGAQTEAPAGSSKWGKRDKPQFYVKDGKNYGYKVSGSVAAANSREATLINQSQKDTLHGLGHGGNIPLGAVKAFTDLKKQQDDLEDETDTPAAIGGRGSQVNSRGGRRGGGRDNSYRKNQAMKKHFAGLSGF